MRDVSTTPVQLERTNRYLGVQDQTHDTRKSRYVLNEHGDSFGARSCLNSERIAKLSIDTDLFCHPCGTEVACGELVDDPAFIVRWRIKSQMRNAPPPREDLLDPAGVEVVVCLSERDVELGLEVG